jgi:hypothetical protein
MNPCAKCGEFNLWCRCIRTALVAFVTITLFYGCAALGGQHSPTGEYLMGVEDALLEHQFKNPGASTPPILLIDFVSRSPVLGKCSTAAGVRYLTIYVGEINRRARDPQHGRLLLAEVLTHELAHGALSCTDADHEVMQ